MTFPVLYPFKSQLTGESLSVIFYTTFFFTGNFKLQTLLGDPRTELKLDVAANENSFAAIGSGSVVKFTNFANDATSITKADLTDDSAPFYIRLSTEATTPGMCVKSDGTALVACAENTDVWSFEEGNISCLCV